MEKLINNLEKNNYKVKYFETADIAKEELQKDIEISKTIGIGGSSTIDSLNIFDLFKERGNEVYWHWKEENKIEAMELANTADIYLSSTNAVTMDGKLINMDGTGNRVSSIIFGHERVYIIIGKNKICNSYEEAKYRIENIAAPKNAERLKLNTPCRFTGKCNDCDSPDRMCKTEVILHKKPNGTDIIIYLINEDLGF